MGSESMKDSSYVQMMMQAADDLVKANGKKIVIPINGAKIQLSRISGEVGEHNTWQVHLLAGDQQTMLTSTTSGGPTTSPNFMRALYLTIL